MVILSTIELAKTKFLFMSNPQSVFLRALINIVAATEILSMTYCFSNVLLVILNFKKVVKSMLNCFAKNKLHVLLQRTDKRI